MATATLLLRLAGPTQAWHVRRRGFGYPGKTSRYSETDLGPTRSGILGLLASAQGRPRGDDMADLLDLDLAVRYDQTGVKRDEFKTSRKRNTGGQVVTEVKRETVLDDACFLVGVHGPRQLLDALYEALQQPRWAPFLGQRAYPPTLPLELGVIAGPDLEGVMREAPWLASLGHRRRRDGTVLLRLTRSRWVGGIDDDVDELAPVEVENPDSLGTPDWLKPYILGPR